MESNRNLSAKLNIEEGCIEIFNLSKKNSSPPKVKKLNCNLLLVRESKNAPYVLLDPIENNYYKNGRLSPDSSQGFYNQVITVINSLSNKEPLSNLCFKFDYFSNSTETNC